MHSVPSKKGICLRQAVTNNGFAEANMRGACGNRSSVMRVQGFVETVRDSASNVAFPHLLRRGVSRAGGPTPMRIVNVANRNIVG